MGSQKRRGLLELLRDWSHHPSRGIRWVQHIWTFWVLALALTGLGGSIFYGESMVGVTGAFVILGGIHAVFWITRKDKPGFQLHTLLPVPFLLVATYNQLYITPAPWIGGLHVGVLWIAFGLFFMTAHSIRRSKDMLIWMGILSGLAILALLGACFEAYINPDWFPVEDRVRSNQYHGSRAAGFFGIPNSFAAFMVLIFPFFVLGAYFRKFSGPMRIFLGFMALATINGILLSVSRGAMIAFVAQMLVMPWFLKDTLRKRIRLLCWILLGGLFVVATLWFSSANLRERVIAGIESGGEATRPPMWQACWQMFTEAPILGRGVNAFYYLWEQYRPEQPRISPRYAHSDYLEILTSYGTLGALLFFVPAIFILWKATRRWKGESYFSINPEQLQRLRKSGHRRLPSKRHLEGHTPMAKVLLGSLLLGMFGFALHLVVDFHLQIPILLFAVSINMGLLVTSIRGPRIEHSKAPVLRIIFPVVPLFVFALAYVFTVPSFYAQYFYFTGNENLKNLLLNPDRIFQEPARIYDAENSLRTAVKSNPGHAMAWGALGSAVLNRYLTELEPSEKTAREALPHVEKALELAPDYWLHHYTLARIYAILEYNPEEVIREARKAVELAPMKPQTHTLLGSLLLGLNQDSEEGKSRLLRATEIDPGYSPAKQKLERLELN